jgi:hypothetical protein
MNNSSIQDNPVTIFRKIVCYLSQKDGKKRRKGIELTNTLLEYSEYRVDAQKILRVTSKNDATKSNRVLAQEFVNSQKFQMSLMVGQSLNTHILVISCPKGDINFYDKEMIFTSDLVQIRRLLSSEEINNCEIRLVCKICNMDFSYSMDREV